MLFRFLLDLVRLGHSGKKPQGKNVASTARQIAW